MMQSQRNLCFVVAAVLVCFVASSSAIKCFHCHSYNNEECAKPIEQVHNDTEWLVDCDDLKDGRNYTFCRKTTQTATLKPEETVRVIRSCGFEEEPKLIPDDGEDPSVLKCYRRTGTYGVEVLFCGCYTDGCNAASSIGINSIAMLVLLFCTIVYHRY